MITPPDNDYLTELLNLPQNLVIASLVNDLKQAVFGIKVEATGIEDELDAAKQAPDLRWIRECNEEIVKNADRIVGMLNAVLEYDGIQKKNQGKATE